MKPAAVMPMRATARLLKGADGVEPRLAGCSRCNASNHRNLGGLILQIREGLEPVNNRHCCGRFLHSLDFSSRLHCRLGLGRRASSLGSLDA